MAGSSYGTADDDDIHTQTLRRPETEDQATVVRFVYPSTELSFPELYRRLDELINLGAATSDVTNTQLMVDLQRTTHFLPEDPWKDVRSFVARNAQVRELSFHTPLLITIAFGAGAAIGLAAIIKGSLKLPSSLQETFTQESRGQFLPETLKPMTQDLPGEAVNALLEGKDSRTLVRANYESQATVETVTNAAGTVRRLSHMDLVEGDKVYSYRPS
jgi:hypothetical protein